MKKFVWKIVIISIEQGEYEIIQGFFRQGEYGTNDKTAHEQFGKFRLRDTRKWEDKDCKSFLLSFYYDDLKYHLWPIKGKKCGELWGSLT